MFFRSAIFVQEKYMIVFLQSLKFATRNFYTNIQPILLSFIFDVIHSSFPSSWPLPIGKPEPSIKWFRDDKEISSGKAYQTSYKKGHVSLKIFKCKSSDSAKYKCVAQNECGTAVSTAQLVVQGQSKYLSLKSAQFIIQK